MTQSLPFLEQYQQSTNKPSLRYLSQSDLIALGAATSQPYVDAIKQGLKLHAQGEVVQPLKPYLRWAGADHIADRIIAMPGYLGGKQPLAGIKWVGSRQHNPSQHQLPRASATLILNDAQTNYPIAVMEGSLISGMRTAAVTVVAAEYLAKPGFESVSCIGAGPIAQMQVLSLVEQFPHIQSFHFFDLKKDMAEKITQMPCLAQKKCQVYNSAEAAVKEGDLVVTCTVTDQPYIHYDWLKVGAFIANVSIMDVHKEVYERVDKVVVDDWEQSNREKKIINQLVLEGRFSKEQLHGELGEIVIGQKVGRENPDEIILLNPMGMAMDDLICAQYFYQQAQSQQIGQHLPFF